MEARSFSLPFYVFLMLVTATAPTGFYSVKAAFSIEEATLTNLQQGFKQNTLTSRELVDFYLEQIRLYNPLLRGVIEVNPEAGNLADMADKERREKPLKSLPFLHGIPVLVKDSMATKDKLSTTAGSFALLGSVVARDAGVVAKLKEAGAIILGKASLTQWSGFRSLSMPAGWNARSGQGLEPYELDDPCGSSSGSAISVSANMAAASLGTETDGSLLCPSSYNSVVGIKPTVGLTSRAGVVPVSSRQDSVGPIGRTVSDAVHILDVIVGIDALDNATSIASIYIPKDGYIQYLNADGLRGKRLGIVPLYSDLGEPYLAEALSNFFKIFSDKNASVVNVTIANIDNILNVSASGELEALLNEFRISLNTYLRGLVSSKVRNLSNVIAFNLRNAELENMNEYGQYLFLEAEKTNGHGLPALVARLEKLSADGLEKTFKENRLDAIVFIGPNSRLRRILAIGGYPGISVPAGYGPSGEPFGIEFGGLKGYEPRLIEIAYAFEQATKIRIPPPFGKRADVTYSM